MYGETRRWNHWRALRHSLFVDLRASSTNYCMNTRLGSRSVSRSRIRSLLTQENICLTLKPDFNLLDAAFPYVARRLLTDPDPALRLRLLKVVIVKGRFEWERLRNLIDMAGVGVKGGVNVPIFALAKDAAHMLATDKAIRKELFIGLHSVSFAEHIKESFSLGCVLLSIAVGRLTQPFSDVRRSQTQTQVFPPHR